MAGQASREADVSKTLPRDLVAKAAHRAFDQAQLFRNGHLLRNAENVRPHLDLTGQDATEWYSAQLSHRSELLESIRSARRDVPADAVPVGQGGPANLHRHFGSGAAALFGVGPWQTSVFLPFSEGVNESSDLAGAHGTIDTRDLYIGPSWYGGLSYDAGEPGREAWWIHNWHCLVGFPPPALPSLLTYRFSLYINTFIFAETLFGSLINFLVVGGLPRLSNTSVVTDGSESWLLDLQFPLPNGGRYGEKSDYVDISGSFMVGANAIPAVSLVTGVIASVARGELRIWGATTPGRTTSLEDQRPEGYGLIEYRYIPEQVLAPT